MSIGLKLDNIVVDIRELMLDPNNYRLAYNTHGKSYDDSEVEGIQTEIERKLEKEKLSDLRDSILENGFLEVDRIVVRKLNGSAKYIVIEGNRRTAALKSLLEDHEDGFIELNKALLSKISTINVVLINSDNPEEIENYANTLMGIRHVSGPKKWTGMQSAKLICDLFIQDKSPTQIGGLLGISAIEANRRRRGYLAFNQMAQDPIFGEKIKNKHYTLLLEFVSKKYIREWLGWSDSSQITKNKEIVYSHIGEDSEGSKPEITNPTQAREFVKAIGIPRYKKLIEGGSSYNSLGPISESTEDIDSELQRFHILLNGVEVDLLSQTNFSTLRSIKNKIDILLAEDE